MDKKGQFSYARKAIFWTVILVVITMIILFFAFMVANYKNSLADVPPKLRAELISLRFTNIPECFAFQESGKTMPNVIDLEKFNEEQMNKCYRTAGSEGIKTINFRLTLVESGEEIITDKYFHHDKPGFIINKEVLVWKNGELVKDLLRIFVQEKIGE